MVALELLSLVLLLTPGVLVEGLADDHAVDSARSGMDAVATLTPSYLLRPRTSRPMSRTPDARPDLSKLSIDVPMTPAVQSFIKFFQTRGRFIFAKWYARMARYEADIYRILARHSVPADLIYVCMIESGFNPDAVSRASAVGPWQFMKPTGREYGLRSDEWIDERRDVLKATDAAARHLKDLYGRFKSWPLALAAYNAGIGAVSRAVKLMGTNDFWRLAALAALPTEATRYVPKAMAAMVVGHNPKLYGFSEIRRERPMTTSVVAVPGGLDVDVLNAKAKLRKGTLTALNSELLRGYTPPYGEAYELRVPQDSRERLEKLNDRAETAKPRVFIEHTVRFGETVRYLSRRYGVSRRTLRRDNRLGRRHLRPGETLIVPRSGKKLVDPLNAALVVLQDPTLEFNLEGRQLVYFSLLRRMSLSEIADFFEVSPGHIAMWNGLDADAALERGMGLRLYLSKGFDRSTALLFSPEKAVKVQAGTEGSLRALKQARKNRGAGVRRKVHTVRRGESLWKIAQRYGVTVEQIRAENGLSRGRSLSPGATLKVPQHIAPRPRGKAARRAGKRGTRGRRYTVRRGDSLWKIARKFSVTVNALRKKNRFKRRPLLKPGQRILIPR
jgi:membrane-bound lytic murein transglycosylase D